MKNKNTNKTKQINNDNNSNKNTNQPVKGWKQGIHLSTLALPDQISHKTTEEANLLVQLGNNIRVAQKSGAQEVL